MPASTTPPLHVLLATERPAIRAFFGNLRTDRVAFVVESWTPTPEALVERLGQVAQRAVVVADMAPDPERATELCRALRRYRPALPVLALFCCADAARPGRLQALLDTGVSGLLDLATPEAKVAESLHDAAHGKFVLRLELNAGSEQRLEDLLCTQTPAPPHGPEALGAADRQLLALLVRGLSDDEMGRRLHVSVHTVRHRLRRLGQALGIPRRGPHSRLELAAWAGAHGLYQPQARTP